MTRPTQTVELKIWPEPFTAWKEGRKRCEFRKNDRDFVVGDKLVLREWNPDTKQYTGREMTAEVTHIETNEKFGIPAGYAVLSLSGRVMKHLK